MKIVSIKWLPCLFIILSFKLLDSLSTGADLNYKNYLTTLIQNTINNEDQSRLANMIEPLRIKYALNNFDDCYEPSYRNQTMHLFNGNFSVHKIVENYYIEEQERVQKLSSTSWKQKVRTLLENVESMIKQVETCLSSPADKRTKVGFTSLTDWTDAEFRRLLGYRRPGNATQNNNIRFAEILSRASKAEIPDTFDWRDKGYVGPIKWQLKCFSCFIFSAVSNVETAYMLQKQTPYDQCQIDLSEQAVLDCMEDPNTCTMGGYASWAWKVMQSRGIFDEHTRPYKGVQNPDECQTAPFNKWGITIHSFIEHDEIPISETELQYLVMEYGAINVGIDASHMKQIRGQTRYDCDFVELNHAVTLIGWDEEFWIIKNSWGTDWGDKGYLYLKRGGNRCGILETQGYAELEK